MHAASETLVSWRVLLWYQLVPLGRKQCCTLISAGYSSGHSILSCVYTVDLENLTGNLIWWFGSQGWDCQIKICQYFFFCSRFGTKPPKNNVIELMPIFGSMNSHDVRKLWRGRKKIHRYPAVNRTPDLLITRQMLLPLSHRTHDSKSIYNNHAKGLSLLQLSFSPSN